MMTMLFVIAGLIVFYFVLCPLIGAALAVLNIFRESERMADFAESGYDPDFLVSSDSGSWERRR